MADSAVDTFDYVIVGAGASGSIMAARLTEDPGVTVCVLEAGPPDRNPWIHIPAGFLKMIQDPGFTWQFRTEPTANTAGRQIATVQGRTLGGSSSINGMIYNRGQPADLDYWAQKGNRGWGYADCLPYYRRTERRIGHGEETRRGREGSLPVTDSDWTHPIADAFIRGCEGLGIPRNKDYNSGDQAGVGYFQRGIHNGFRVSAARAFLRPAMKRSGLEVRTNARAQRILFDGRRAVGVHYIRERGGEPTEVRARREVILCSGTANTARLLQVSGVGPAWLLDKLGVPVIRELPVGENFRDHYASRVVVRAKKVVPTLNEMAKGLRLVGEVAKWALKRPSILSIVPSPVHLFWKSFEGLDQPDLQCVFTPGSYAEGKVYVLDDYPGFTAGAWQHRPESVGWVRARSTDVFENPEIQPNYLTDPMDIRVHLGGIRLLRRVLGTPEMAQYTDVETLPGPKLQGDDELLDFARRNGSTTYHLVGTCRMGPEEDRSTVVNDRLQVHGLEGLRVADASIMPHMPSANTYATTMMIAEKGSDIIRGRTPLPAAEIAA